MISDQRRNLKGLAALASVLLLVQITGASNSARNITIELRALCSGRQVELRSVRHLVLLAGELGSDGGACSNRVKEAIVGLAEIVKDKKACTNEKADAIIGFVHDYLRNSAKTDELADSPEAIPKPLAKFAIAYGMKVSKICQHLMLNRFSKEAFAELSKIYGDKWGDFEFWLSRKSSISFILYPIVRTGEIILPTDLMAVVPGMESKMESFLTKDRKLAVLREICRNQLQPLYEPILLPIGKLIRAGFNNRPHYWRPKFRGNSRFWSVAVFMCETLKGVQVADETQNGISESEQVAIESDLRQATDDVASELSEPDDQDSLSQVPVSKINTETDDLLVPDEIIDGTVLNRFDFSLKSLVKRFDANKNETERLRGRILERSFRVFKRLSRKFNHKPMWRKFFKNLVLLKNSNKDFERARDGLLELMDAPEGVSLPYKFKVGIELFGLLLQFLLALMVSTIVILPMWLLNISEKHLKTAGSWVFSWMRY